MKNEKFNLIVIGAGSGGLVAALIAAAVKARVALIERDKMGGDCLNTGCVPSKALIRTAKFLHDMKNHEKFGVKVAHYEYDFQDVMTRVHKIVKTIEPHDSVERFSGLGVECFQGDAKIIDKHTVEVGGKTLKTRAIIIATGAEPLIPDIEGLQDVNYLTSENLWELQELPQKLIVLGGGAIGCEMAQAFARLGSEVTQIELVDRILPRSDIDISAFMADHFKSEGIRVLTGTKPIKIERQSEGGKLICETSDNKTLHLNFDQILVAVGRKARSDQFDLKRLGITLNPNQTIQTDRFLRVNGDNIYACGDIIGPYQFTHAASHQAWYATVNALFSMFRWVPKIRHSIFSADYSVLPRVTFTSPEVAEVGLSEKDAKEKNIPYEVIQYGIDDLDRAIAESSNYGLVKVLVPPGKDKILGATVVGEHAGEMITEFVNGMKQGFGLNGILGTIHAYPTFSEANKFAAGVWKKKHAPQGLLEMLRKWFAYRRGP